LFYSYYYWILIPILFSFYTLGVTTLEQLKQQKLTNIQALGLKYLSDFAKRASRAEVKQLYKHVQEAALAIDSEIILRCCGSYRRKCVDCGDIDILLAHPRFTTAHMQLLKTGANQSKKAPSKNNKKAQQQDLSEEEEESQVVQGSDPMNIIARLVALLKKRCIIVDDLFQGSLQYSGVCRLPGEEVTSANESVETNLNVARKIDIKIFPIESFHTGLLTYTGSGEFIRQLCTIALNKGFKLNEYHLVPVGLTAVEGECIAVSSEREIFEMLGVAYREPRLRSFGGTHLNKNRNI
jgi:DNA polymerase/3'-5' exonuclease PolX